jgi:DNA-binding response OmpR family regulator
MTQPVVLVVEDDAPIRQGLVDALTFGGFGVIECGDGREGLDLAIESELDLVLLDVMLPQMNGFDVLEGLRRARPTLPVIMLTARGAEEDRVRGLSGGADDYVIKPFSARELLARVEAVLRRSPQRAHAVRRLSLDGIVIDLERREVVRSPDDPSRPLTEREVAILHYLAMSRDRAVDRSELLRHVWGLDPRGLHTRTVDMHIARLREKIEANPAEPGVILTVRGKGYMLADAVATEAS